MDFVDQLKQFSDRVDGMKNSLPTEEATKTAIIMPFFSLLGYDVFNPNEFLPEFTADVGTKKGEKVDYAIMNEGEPTILIEAKWIGASLEKHDSQLFRYFGTTAAKFGILTNGIIYKFYTDLETPNKMDLKPFLEIDILDIKEVQVSELKNFHKSNFDVESVMNTASELKYTNAFKTLFANQLQNPSDDTVRLFLSDVYSGLKTQAVIDKFRPVLKKALNQYISEKMNDKIKSALEVVPETTDSPVELDLESPSKIITTAEEIEAFYIIKSILADTLNLQDISYRDTENYLSIIYKGMVTKWICRLALNSPKKQIVIPAIDKTQKKYVFANLDEIYNYRAEIIESSKRFLTE